MNNGELERIVVENVTSAPVWVVDDDRAIRWVLSRALSRAGIESRTFDRAQAVLDALKSEQPQVLVSDIRMPGMTGVELLARIKAEAPDLPVIIMTAYSDLDSAVSAFQGGAFEYLAKPFDVPKAVELIQRAMKECAEVRRASDAAAEGFEPESSPAVRQMRKMH